jgi:DNA-binding response OmpR family regulator
MAAVASVMLVEDDRTIGEPLSRALISAGHRVHWVTTGHDAEVDVFDVLPDIVLLDLGLPDVDGIEVCRRIRQSHPDTPILMLTARREEMDVVEGLDAGAVDYITKPFRLAELLARIRANARAASAARVRIGDLSIDVPAHRAFLGDDELELSPKEFDLLVALARRPGEAVRRETLLDHVWGPEFERSAKTLDVHIAWLRRKLGDDAEHPRYIATVRGFGYRFESA